MRKGGKTYTKKAHHLVLEAFVGKRPRGYVTRHMNGDPLDNRVENLCWGTPKENHADSVKHGTASKPPIRMGERNHMVTISDEDVSIIRSKEYKRGLYSRLARKYGVAPITISRIYNGVYR